jgi:AAA domain
MIEAKEMEKEKPSSKLKLAEVGAEKNGKSLLAATGRKPVLFHDFDNRAEALSNKPGVYVLSYVDPMWPKQPEAAQDFLNIIDKLERGLDLREIHPKFASVSAGVKVKTNVVDSISTCGKAFQRYALYNSSDLRRELTIGSMKVFVPRNFDAWNSEMTSVENSVLRLLALPSDTIVILHEMAEEAPDSTDEKPKYTGRVNVYPARYKLLLKYFNEVWRVKLTQSVDGNNKLRYLPKVYPLPTYEFDAASTLSLGPVEDPDISKMLKKFE